MSSEWQLERSLHSELWISHSWPFRPTVVSKNVVSFNRKKLVRKMLNRDVSVALQTIATNITLRSARFSESMLA